MQKTTEKTLCKRQCLNEHLAIVYISYISIYLYYNTSNESIEKLRGNLDIYLKTDKLFNTVDLHANSLRKQVACSLPHGLQRGVLRGQTLNSKSWKQTFLWAVLVQRSNSAEISALSQQKVEGTVLATLLAHILEGLLEGFQIETLTFRAFSLSNWRPCYFQRERGPVLISWLNLVKLMNLNFLRLKHWSCCNSSWSNRMFRALQESNWSRLSAMFILNNTYGNNIDSLRHLDRFSSSCASVLKAVWRFSSLFMKTNPLFFHSKCPFVQQLLSAKGGETLKNQNPFWQTSDIFWITTTSRFETLQGSLKCSLRTASNCWPFHLEKPSWNWAGPTLISFPSQITRPHI